MTEPADEGRVALMSDDEAITWIKRNGMKKKSPPPREWKRKESGKLCGKEKGSLEKS